jgi:hypothetical protein
VNAHAEKLTIAPELEESSQTSSTLVTQPQGTTALATIQGTLDVILEDTGGTIIRETLAEFDDGDEESGLGQRVTNAPQRPLLFFCGSFAAEVLVLVVIRNDLALLRGRRVQGVRCCLLALVAIGYRGRKSFS